MYMLRRRPVIPWLAILIVVSIPILYIFQRDEEPNPEPYFINWTVVDTISCHYVTEGDALPSAEDTNPPPDSIFFHETSCRGGLNSRQACAVESAARVHPERNVYVFFNSPISDFVLKRSCLSKLAQFRNVKLARVHIAEYTKGTPLGQMLANRENNRSHYKIEHTADMLRFVTLYKFGGLYLDTDVIVVKPLDDLGKNWAARESDDMVNVAAFAMGTDKIGHYLASTVLEDISSDFQPDQWAYNGPWALNRVLWTFCNTSKTPELSGDVCHGFQVYNPDKIYPIHWSQYDKYFSPGELPQDKVADAYSHHLWNRLTKEIDVAVGSPFEKIANKHCPTIRAMFGERFGS